jgi:hypothetical protein
MTVEIHIAGKLVESIPMDLEKCKSYEERKSKVITVEQWLKYRYQKSMIIKSNWEIMISVESKMNKIKVKKEKDYERID